MAHEYVSLDINDTSTQDICVQSLLDAMWARIPAMLVSDPGMAKTATIHGIAKQMGYEVITLVGARIEPQDVTGFPGRVSYTTPVYDSDGKPVIESADTTVDENGVPQENIRYKTVERWRTDYAPQWWQVEIMNKRKVILFLDEFSNSQPAVRASFLSLIQDRQFPNGEKFPEETIIVGAMNPTDSATDGWEIDKPTANRMMFINWDPSFQSWAGGMLENWGKEISDNERAWRVHIVDFLSKNISLLHKMPSIESVKDLGAMGEATTPSSLTVASLPYPTRRSWDMLARILGRYTLDYYSSYAVQKTIRGTVGGEAAIAFIQYMKKRVEFDPQEILRDPNKYAKNEGFNNLTLDQVHLLMEAALSATDRKGLENLLLVWRYLVQGEHRSAVEPRSVQVAKRAGELAESGAVEDARKMFGEFVKEMRA